MDMDNYADQYVAELISNAGYVLETHKNIATEDGYFLTLHRILHPNNGYFLKAEKRQPILLVHGMLGCTGHFLLLGKQSLPYFLLEAGYDVWLGNVRGVIYSKGHQQYNYAKDQQYWKFSMHELGYYDMPAMIDYILNVTHSETLKYIGYSQGCVIFFIMCSERPEYARKIALFTGLSPLIFIKGAKHPWLPILSMFQSQLRYLTNCMGINGLRVGFLRKYQAFLTGHSWTKAVIKFVIYATFGTKIAKIKDESVTPTLKFFQGINFHCVYHAMQIFNKKRFIQYDYGPKQNLEVYGATTVRDYIVENVTCPVLLFYSDQDWFMPGENVNILTSKLSNVVGTHRVDSNDFSHFDFLIAEEAIEKLYKPMLETFHKLQCTRV